MKDSYLVLKREDISKHLSSLDKAHLKSICRRVAHGRLAEGKETNRYLVINRDEPYADEVIEILKRNGHWD